MSDWNELNQHQDLNTESASDPSPTQTESANPTEIPVQNFGNIEDQNSYTQSQNNPYGTYQNGQPYQQGSYSQGYTNYNSQPGYGSSYNGQNPYYQNQNPNYNGYNNYNPYGTQPYQQPQQPQQPAKKKGRAAKVLCVVLAIALIFGSLGYGISRAVTARSNQTPATQVEASTPATQKDDTTASSAVTSNLDSSETITSSIQARNEAFANSKLALSLSDNSEPVLTIPEVVQKTADSVVEITTEYVTTSNYLQQYISSGAGSGVIITSDGYIVTNNHVIANARQITVTLRNGETYPATLVGLDEDLDVALLKIDATGLTVATIGTSEDLLVGQTIIAIGNPLGQLGGSVTHGIISALDRDITVEGTSMTLMQIDASINPGNSGGALFDEQGTLVGIVNAKSTGDDVEGIGFAIPIDHVISILNDLQEYGYVKGRVSLGITMVDINTDSLAWMYRVNDLGVYIYSVNENSAAETSGLKSGDRVVSVDGTTITSSSDIKQIVQSHKVGDVLNFLVVRNGEEQTIPVTIGEYIPSDILNNQTLQ